MGERIAPADSRGPVKEVSKRTRTKRGDESSDIDQERVIARDEEDQR